MFSFTSFSVNHDLADKTANVQIEFGNYAGVIGVLPLPRKRVGILGTIL